jgi:hypothetical protein
MARIYDPQVQFDRRLKKLHKELSPLTLDSVDVIGVGAAPQAMIRILLPDFQIELRPAYVQVSMTVNRIVVTVVAREKLTYTHLYAWNMVKGEDAVLREAVEKVFSLVNSEFTEDSVDMWLV